MAVIEISDMEFYAFHGCFQEEQKIGTRFVVNLSLVVDTTVAQRSDMIDDTVSYLSVYQEVKRQMEIPSHLLENVADRIASAILAEFPTVESVSVKVSKMNPPLGGKIGAASLLVEKSKS